MHLSALTLELAPYQRLAFFIGICGRAPPPAPRPGRYAPGPVAILTFESHKARSFEHPEVQVLTHQRRFGLGISEHKPGTPQAEGERLSTISRRFNEFDPDIAWALTRRKRYAIEVSIG